MSHPTSDFPPPLRAAGATDFERRLLAAAAQEEPSPELSARMAAAVGLSAAALGTVAAGATLAGSTAASATAAVKSATVVSKAALGTSALWPWISAGVLGLVAAGVVVAMRARTAPVPQPRAHPPAMRVAPPPSVESPAAPAPEPSTSLPGEPRGKPAGAADVVHQEPSREGTRPPAGLPSNRRPEAAPQSDVRAQIELVDKARVALAAGDGQRALELVRRYVDKYPTGAFRPEAAALNVEALVKLGRTAEARAQAERFIAEHAGSPLADRVARMVGWVQP